MNAGAATWMIPTAAPNSVSTASVTRIPGASSGPSQPTACGSPRQRREAWVTLNAGAPPALTAARHQHGGRRRDERDDRARPAPAR